MKKGLLIISFFNVLFLFSQDNIKLYSKYDFIAGDKIIFQDDLTDETTGEFPSRWKLVSGAAETMKKDETNVIAFLATTEIAPNTKKTTFLSEQFTLEFDIFFYNKYNEAYYVIFDKIGKLDIRKNKLTMKAFSGVNNPQKIEGWHHIAIAFNNKQMKVYFDEQKILNIPDAGAIPTKFSISGLSFGIKDGNPALIKNITLAEGGMPLYKKLMIEGKIVTRGILFDVGKSTIKSESMGTINEIVKLLKENPDLKLSIEGHTDSDGDEKNNQLLSENRSKAVKDLMISMGIDEAKLQSKGFGESKPLSPNNSPEEKANNRRVEFVKL